MKSFYRRNLPHYSDSGQRYFLTKCLKSTGYPYELEKEKQELDLLRIEYQIIRNGNNPTSLRDELHNKYVKAKKLYQFHYDKYLEKETNSEINLCRDDIGCMIVNEIAGQERKSVHTFALCVMRNHIHWVFTLLDTYSSSGDELSLPAYLRGLFARLSKGINNMDGVTGRQVWQRESFDTTVRDLEHLYRAVRYTLRNPVEAGLCAKASDWPFFLCDDDYAFCLNE